MQKTAHCHDQELPSLLEDFETTVSGRTSHLTIEDFVVQCAREKDG